METLDRLSQAQRQTLDKLRALIGDDQIDHIVAQGPEVLEARMQDFMQFEAALIGQVHEHVASAMLTHYITMSDKKPKARSLALRVKAFDGRGERISFSGFEKSEWR